jgi:hypothetical protein
VSFSNLSSAAADVVKKTTTRPTKIEQNKCHTRGDA